MLKVRNHKWSLTNNALPAVLQDSTKTLIIKDINSSLQVTDIKAER